ncbi:MAG: hypothetical protein U0T83_03465 [Bacteriovoracaceae bacterium]
MIKRLFKNKQGQTATEYIMMLSVAAVLIFSIMTKLKNYLIGSGDCPNESFVCRSVGIYTGNNYFEGNYQYFKIKR